MDCPCDLIGQDLKRGLIVVIKDVHSGALNVKSPHNPFSDPNGNAEFGPGGFFFPEGDNSPGFARDIVRQDRRARFHDAANDTPSDFLPVAVLEEGFIVATSGPENDVSLFFVLQKKRRMVVVEVLLDGLNHVLENLVRVQSGQSQLGHLADGGEVGGPPTLLLQQTRHLLVALNEFGFNLDAVCDVCDDGEAAEVVAEIVPKRGARDTDRNPRSPLMLDFDFVGRRLSLFSPRQLGQQAVVGLRRIDARDVPVDDFIAAEPGDLFHPSVKERDGLRRTDGGESFVHRLQQGLEAILGRLKATAPSSLFLTNPFVASVVVELSKPQKDFVHRP